MCVSNPDRSPARILQTLPRGWQIFFNPVDQLGNIHRLSQNWMPLNVEARLWLSSRDQPGEKDNGRSLQPRIGLDLYRYVASVSFWHHYVEQDQFRPEILRGQPFREGF